MIENFKEIVTARLAEAGILANENESIFSSDKLFENEQDTSLMLVSPNKDAWVFVGSAMPEKELKDAIERFIQQIRASALESVKAKISINQNISLKEYLEGLAKLIGGTAPTAKIGTTPLRDLIAQLDAAPDTSEK